MNALERAVAGAALTLKSVGGTQVVYSRRGHQSEPLTAVRTVAEYRVIDAKSGGAVRVKFHDWLFVASELVLDGKTVKPQNGDEIAVGEQKFSVCPIEKRPCFEPHDAGGRMIVVHTTQIQ